MGVKNAGGDENGYGDEDRVFWGRVSEIGLEGDRFRKDQGGRWELKYGGEGAGVGGEQGRRRESLEISLGGYGVGVDRELQ